MKRAHMFTFVLGMISFAPALAAPQNTPPIADAGGMPKGRPVGVEHGEAARSKARPPLA